ncbi:unnamed protein product [Linum trigynum]
MRAQKEKDKQNKGKMTEPGEGHCTKKKDQIRIQSADVHTPNNPPLGQLGMGGALQQFVMGTAEMKSHP